SVSTTLLASGMYGASHLAEADPDAVRARCARPDGDRVAVGEERSGRTVGQGHRLLAVPAELEERTSLPRLGTRDRARGEQVSRTDAGAVDRQVRELLGRSPVHLAERR